MAPESAGMKLIASVGHLKDVSSRTVSQIPIHALSTFVATLSIVEFPQSHSSIWIIITLGCRCIE